MEKLLKIGYTSPSGAETLTDDAIDCCSRAELVVIVIPYFDVDATGVRRR